MGYKKVFNDLLAWHFVEYTCSGRRYSEDYLTKPNLLGQGGYGFVRLSRRKSKADSEENFLATKVIAKDCLEDWQQSEGTITEAAILMKLSHKNIVKVTSLNIHLPTKDHAAGARPV